MKKTKNKMKNIVKMIYFIYPIFSIFHTGYQTLNLGPHYSNFVLIFQIFSTWTILALTLELIVFVLNAFQRVWANLTLINIMNQNLNSKELILTPELIWFYTTFLIKFLLFYFITSAILFNFLTPSILIFQLKIDIRDLMDWQIDLIEMSNSDV